MQKLGIKMNQIFFQEVKKAAGISARKPLRRALIFVSGAVNTI